MTIDQQFVEAVENEVGMGSAAWDCIDPVEVCQAVVKVYREKILDEAFPLDSEVMSDAD